MSGSKKKSQEKLENTLRPMKTRTLEFWEDGAIGGHVITSSHIHPEAPTTCDATHSENDLRTGKNNC